MATGGREAHPDRRIVGRVPEGVEVFTTIEFKPIRIQADTLQAVVKVPASSGPARCRLAARSIAARIHHRTLG
jgi:hypothetical protein